jgi:hypothetical protein
MAANTEPVFVKTPICKVAAVSSANTNRDGTGTIVDILTAGADGARIEEIVAKATADPADSVLTIFIHNGTSYFLWDEMDLGNPAAASTTAEAYRVSRTYENLVLESGHKLAAAITVALTAGVVNVWALGGSLSE